MIGQAVRRLEKRANAVSFVRKALGKVFPDHWSFLLGELALYSFVVLVLTGVFLLFYYVPSGDDVVYQGSYTPLQGVSVSKAYASVLDMSFDVRGALVVRQAHHWAALVFAAAIAVHAARVFFTGAFRRPRQRNWAIGVTMLALVLANGFFGLSLPDDLLSGTGLRIAYTFALSVPLVGPALAFLVFAGEFPAAEMISRLYWLHILVLPVAIAGLLGYHLSLVWRQTHTQFAGGRRRRDNVVGDRMWPGYAVKTTAVLLFVAGALVALGGLAQINPVWLYGPFEPAAVTVPAQPDWYLGWVEGALRIFPPVSVRAFGFEVPTPFFSGILLPLGVFAVLYAWPGAEARLTGDHGTHHLAERPRDRPVRTALGVAGMAFLGVLLGAGSHDLQGQILGVGVDTMTVSYRVLLFVVPPAAGALAWKLCHDLQARATSP